MPDIPTFEEYLGSLGRLGVHADPTIGTPQSEDIKEAAASLADLSDITLAMLTTWVAAHPKWVYVLGLAAGLSQEKLKNNLKYHLGTPNWTKLAREDPSQLIATLEDEFQIVRLVSEQRDRSYSFGDILAARAGTRVTAKSAATLGRMIEDRIEAIVSDLELPYETRTRFIGRDNLTGPCDIVIPASKNADIAIAAKAFDSTGSKLTAAYDEIKSMADVRQPRQFIMAVIDGIGWHSRLSDLRRIHHLWERRQIDGMYTLATLDRFRDELEHAARLHGLLPPRL